jgi:uncharacterized membrane protein (UPF0127 family)
MKKREKISLRFGDKNLEVEGQVCDNVFSQARGLMFRSRSKAPVLIFKFDRDVREPIHSLFVQFSFVSIWLDENFKVVEKRRVEPWKFYICPRENFRYFVEVPISEGNKKILDDIERFK